MIIFMAVFKRINLSAVESGSFNNQSPILFLIAISSAMALVSMILGSALYEGYPFFQKLYLDLVSTSFF